METYEKLVDAREARHYIHSQQEWDSMTDEEKSATGCAYPAMKSNIGWEGALVRNNLHKSLNKDYMIDTRVDARADVVDV